MGSEYETSGIAQQTCSTCGRRKARAKFPRVPGGLGVLPTCLQCRARTALLAARVELRRRPSRRGWPIEPIQLALRRRLETRTQVQLARELQTTTERMMAVIRSRRSLDLVSADRWAIQLGEHLDTLYEGSQ